MNPVERALQEAVRRLARLHRHAAARCRIAACPRLRDRARRIAAAAADRAGAGELRRRCSQRRCAGEPVAYIIGHRAFWNIELEVGPGALIPRPDSETLIEAAIEHFAGSDGPERILDLGTGPGTLLLAALDQWPRATGLGVDFERGGAGLCAAQCRAAGPRAAGAVPARRLGEAGDRAVRPRCCATRLMSREDAELGPGVAEHEPAEALFGGADGLDDYRRLAPEVGRLLAPGGLAAIEIGYDQGDSAAALFAAAGARADPRARPWRAAAGAADPGLSKKAWKNRGPPLHLAQHRSALWSRPRRSPTYLFRFSWPRRRGGQDETGASGNERFVSRHRSSRASRICSAPVVKERHA